MSKIKYERLIDIKEDVLVHIIRMHYKIPDNFGVSFSQNIGSIECFIESEQEISEKHEERFASFMKSLEMNGQ